MDDLIASYLHYVQAEHARTGYETNPHELCKKLDIKYVPGEHNLANAGPPSIVIINVDQYGSRRLFSSAHEIAHVLMARGGFKKRIKREHACLGLRMKSHIERIADYAAGTLLMPEPILREAWELYGDTPRAIVHVATVSGASMPAAMRRWVMQDLTASRAAFLVHGKYVRDLATCNISLPFERHERLPEPTIRHPGLRVIRYRPGRYVGMPPVGEYA